MRVRGLWSLNEATDFLRGAVIPLRLAVLDGAGFPIPISLWFLLDEGAVWCATKQESVLVKRLERDARCGFEVAADAPPYRGVRGIGRVSIVRDRGLDVLSRLLERYSIHPESHLARTLLSQAHREVALRIDPDSLTSWDFSARMKGAIKA